MSLQWAWDGIGAIFSAGKAFAKKLGAAVDITSHITDGFRNAFR